MTDQRMQPFSLALPNGATLTGLRTAPKASLVSGPFRPLVVLSHGGTYCSSYFDADAKHTASLSSEALGIPVVAIDRPCYGGSTSFMPLPEGVSYHDELAKWLHSYILPTLWKEYGLSQGCNTIVLHCHSLAVPSAIILAAWQENNTSYPLGGVTFSGWGTRNTQSIKDHKDPEPIPEYSNFPIQVKDMLMMPPGTADPEIYRQTSRLDQPMLTIERRWSAEGWYKDDKWKALCAAVKFPVLIGMPERDALWEGDAAHVAEWVAEFKNCPRMEASVIPEAPHCQELSNWAQGWYTRCFGFAMECAASAAAKEAGVPAAQAPAH